MNKAKAFNTFKLIGANNIPAIKAQVELYEHKVTGAKHVHIAADNTENVFSVLFRTMPDSSNGVAHILEHTALCGSAKYPTRDPFFSMIRRSLNSFMNAMTSTDWTMYPFASPNKKDFNNLLGVYLDATFFPRLAEIDFRQEGHRVDFKTPGDKTTDLEFKGVVFNEMKGAMSSAESVVYGAITNAIYSGTTYEVNSGGEPADIPSLTYKQFVDFHKTHYHPTNAIFMTYGDIAAAEHQEKFETNVLHKFQKLNKSFSVPNVKRFTAPKTKYIKYAFDGKKDKKGKVDTTKRTFIAQSWLMGQTTDMYENLKTKFLYMVLLGDTASPLSAVLENTKLGTSPWCYNASGNKEGLMFIGLEGSEAKHEKALEKLIMDTLNKVAVDGISADRISALLDQIEVSVRNLESGDPLGLSTLKGLLNSAVHGGDLLNALDVEPVLTKLRAETANPDFVKNLVKGMLINNKHRVTIVAEPDTKLSQAKNDAEADVLAKMKAKMSDSDMDDVIQQAKDLDARQSAPDDTSCLPTVTMDDIEVNKTYPQGSDVTDANVKATAYEVGTNGLVSQKIVINLPNLTERQLRLLPYYSSLVTEVAIGNRSYLEAGEWQTSICSGFGASYTLRSILGDVDNVNAYISFASSGLERHSAEMTDMMIETINNVSFREHDRLKDLVGQIKLGKESSITGNGHSIAAAAASHGMSACGDIGYKIGGIESVRFVKELYKSFDDMEKVASFAKELEEIHELVKVAPRQVMAIAETEKMDAITAKLTKEVATLAVDSGSKAFVTNKVNETVNDMWVMNTGVNFCAKAYKAVPSTHADGPALQVLGSYMKNNYIHTAIREKGGAYGGMASYNADNGTFAFTSYRDPRLSGTLADYDSAIEWMKTAKHDEEKVREAIFGIVSSIDAPKTPMKDASTNYSARLHGRTDDVRSDFRKRILAVTVADLVRVTNTYLDPSKANTAVITSEAGLAAEGNLGLNVIQL